MPSTIPFANVLHSVDLGNGRSLATAANGYRSNTSSHSGVTLILVHGAGHRMTRSLPILSHPHIIQSLADKELWEPTVEELFRLPVASSIREVWSFDMPSHGQAAQVNARQLEINPVASRPWSLDVLS